MTSPGGRGGMDLTALWVPVLPETSKLAAGVESAGREAKGKFEKATEGMGATMAKGVDQAAKQGAQAMATLVSSAQSYEKATRAAEDAAGKLRTTQVKLEAVMNSSKSTAVQISTATEAYSRAQRANAAATAEAQRATTQYQHAQSELSTTVRQSGNDAEEADRKHSSAFSNLGVKAGAMAGLVSEGIHLVTESIEVLFEKTLETGTEVVKHIFEVGEAWENVEHQIEIHSNASAEELEGLNRAAEQMARSGASVSLRDLGGTLAVLHQRLGDLDNNQLKTLSGHLLELGERFEEPIDIQKFTGAMKGFGVPAGEVDKALESIVHTAQASGQSLNQVIEGIAKAGPTARNFGLDIGQVGGFMATLSQAGIDPGRSIMSLNSAAGKFAKEGIPLNQGLQQMISNVRDLLATGKDSDATEAFKRITAAFGSRGGGAIFDQIRAGTIDMDTFAHSTDVGGMSLDELIEKTETFGTRMEGLQNMASEALRPLGIALVSEMSGGLDKAASWIGDNTDKIIGWLKTAGDYSIGFVHTAAQMGAGVLKAWGYMSAGGTIMLQGLIRAISSLTGYIGGFLDTIGMDGMGNALKDLSSAGTSLADGLAKLPDVLGAAGAGLDRLADATGSDLQNGFDGFMDKTQQAAIYTKALGDAIIHVPDSKHITLEDNSPETVANLKKLGITVETLPDGTVTVTADNAKAKKTFEEYVKEVEDKEVEVELRAKPTDDHGNETSNPSAARDAIEKMFGLDQGPFNVPMAAGSSPFALPPPGGGGYGGAGGGGGAPGAPGGSGLPGPLGQLPGMPHGGNAFGGQSMPPTPPPAGVSQSNYATAWQEFLGAGFDPSQWQDFVNLEMHEAGFRADAENPSGAFGMGQFMPYTWAPYGPKTLDPQLQLQYMMAYIKDRYGSPAAAWAQYFNHRNGEGSYATGYVPGYSSGYTETLDGSGGSLPSTNPDPSGHYPFANEQNRGKQDKESQKPWWLQALDFMAGTADHSYATGYTETFDGSGGSLPSVAPDPSGHYAFSNEQNRGKKDKESQKPWWLQALDFMAGTSDHSYSTGYTATPEPGSGGSLPPYAPNKQGIYSYANWENLGKKSKEEQKPMWLRILDFMAGTSDNSYAKGSGSLRMIKGPGTGTSDSIFGMLGPEPIRVSNGESINTALSTAMNLPWIRAMNRGLVLPGTPRGFKGGLDDFGVNTDGAQVNTIAVADAIRQYFPGITDLGLYRSPDGYDEHSSGEAADAMIPNWDSPAGKALGDQVSQYVLSNAQAFGVQYTIWQNRMWYPDGHSTDYGHDPNNPTDSHMNHVHIRTTGGGYPAGGGPGAAGAGNVTSGTSSPTPAPAALNQAMGGAFNAPGGGGGGGGYTATQYPGYFMAPDGSYVTADQVRDAGNYGGATRGEIDQALKARDQAQQSVEDRNAAVTAAQQNLDKLKAGKVSADGLVTTPATQEEIDAATAALARARREAADAESNKADADQKYTETLNKPPEATKGKKGTGPGDKDAASLGSGLVKGAMESLGFDGSVFEDPTNWGIWKLFTGGVNYAGGLMKNAFGGPTNNASGGAMDAPFAGGGGGGLLDSLFGGLMQSTGINLPTLPTSAAATVSTAPGAPGLPSSVSAPGTVVPGSGQVGVQGTGPLPGPAAAPAGLTINGPTFNGITDVPAIASAVGGVQIQQSRALNVGQPMGGLPAPVGI